MSIFTNPQRLLPADVLSQPFLSQILAEVKRRKSRSQGRSLPLSTSYSAIVDKRCLKTILFTGVETGLGFELWDSEQLLFLNLSLSFLSSLVSWILFLCLFIKSILGVWYAQRSQETISAWQVAMCPLIEFDGIFFQHMVQGLFLWLFFLVSSLPLPIMAYFPLGKNGVLSVMLKMFTRRCSCILRQVCWCMILFGGEPSL